jgi:hypothetical protein
MRRSGPEYDGGAAGRPSRASSSAAVRTDRRGTKRATRVVLNWVSAPVSPEDAIRRPLTTSLPRRAARGLPGVRARSSGRGGRYFSAAPPLAFQRSVPSCLLRDPGHSKRPDQANHADYGG